MLCNFDEDWPCFFDSWGAIDDDTAAMLRVRQASSDGEPRPYLILREANSEWAKKLSR